MINNNVKFYYEVWKEKQMEKNKKPLLPKSTLIIRLIAGGYLIYLAYELLMGLNQTEGAPMPVTIGAAFVFAVCGLVLVIMNGRDFLKGNFKGGIMDKPEEEE